MTKKVLITGVAGTGKSTICAALQDHGYTAYDIEAMDELFTMIHTDTGEVLDSYDSSDLASVKQRDWICDRAALEGFMANSTADMGFYCGTAANLALNDCGTVNQVHSAATPRSGTGCSTGKQAGKNEWQNVARF